VRPAANSASCDRALDRSARARASWWSFVRRALARTCIAEDQTGHPTIELAVEDLRRDRLVLRVDRQPDSAQTAP